MQDALLAEVTRLGARAYLAPGYDCGRWVGDEEGRLKRVRNDALGREGFATARAWIEKNDGAADGRVRGILVPARGRDREPRSAADDACARPTS